MKQSVWILALPLLFALSCATEQAAVPEDPPPQSPAETAPVIMTEPVRAEPIQEEAVKEEPQEEPEEKLAEKPFDPTGVSQEEYDTAIQDIQGMILKLNDIVREKNFKAWMSYLADSSIAKINSREFLDEKANDLYRKNMSNAAVRGQDVSRVRKINFRNPQDYFNYVVVPSHANDHVDEIAFNSQTQVTAYIRDEKGQRLILYDLEHIDGQWRIIIVS
ncbi:MAG: hypothetical protein LBH26_03705 [Treponema sp.]|jgi:hypothetical protein|nr:hypothetical protein [Treponema sp.]